MAEVAAGKIIGTDKRLTDFDRPLLWVMTSYLTFGSWMKVQQSQLAEDMGSSASQISRSVKRLVDAGVITKAPISEQPLGKAPGVALACNTLSTSRAGVPIT